MLGERESNGCWWTCRRLGARPSHRQASTHVHDCLYISKISMKWVSIFSTLVSTTSYSDCPQLTSLSTSLGVDPMTDSNVSRDLDCPARRDRTRLSIPNHYPIPMGHPDLYPRRVPIPTMISTLAPSFFAAWPHHTPPER